MDTRGKTAIRTHKVLLVGPCSGKSVFVIRLVDDVYAPNQISTIGIDFKVATFSPGEKFQIWDTVGNERFQEITLAYLRGASCIIFAAAIDGDSYDTNTLKYWFETVHNHEKSFKKLAVLLRCDSEASDQSLSLYSLSKQYKVPYFECSSKTGHGIQEIKNELLLTATDPNYTSPHLITKVDPAFLFRHNKQQTLIHRAARSGDIDIIDGVIHNTKGLIEKVNDDGNTPVIVACLNNKLAATKHLITKYNANYLHKNNTDNQTIVHHAVMTNDIEMIDYILSLKGTNELLNHVDIDGNTALLLSCINNKFSTTKHLITKYNSNYLHKNNNNQTILHYYAATSNDIEMIDYILLLEGTNELLDHVDIDGNTPLLLSCINNQFSTTKHLITKYNANYFITNNNNKTILHLIIKSNMQSYFYSDLQRLLGDKIEMLDYIMSLQGGKSLLNQVDDDGASPFLLACTLNEQSIKLLKRLINEYGADYLIKNNNHETVLDYAIQSSKIEIIDYIMSLPGVKDFLEVVHKDGTTPLLLAYDRKLSTSAKHLITKYNANHLFTNNINQSTILHYAAKNLSSTLDFVLSLDGVEEYLNSVDTDGNTPLLISFINKNLSSAKHLMPLIDKYQASYLIKNKKQRNILHYFCQASYIDEEEIDSVLELPGVKDLINEVDIDGNTPVMLAFSSSNFDSAERLITKYKANHLINNNNNATILHYFVQSRHVSNVDFAMGLKGVKGFIDKRDNDGNTPLFYACSTSRSFSNVQHLITKYKTNYLATNNNNQSILHYAVKSDSHDIIDYIMSLKGVAQLLNNTDKFGNTPLFYACAENKSCAVKYLISKYQANYLVKNPINGQNILHVAMLNSNNALVNYLISFDQVKDLLNISDNDGITPLILQSSKPTSKGSQHQIGNVLPQPKSVQEFLAKNNCKDIDQLQIEFGNYSFQNSVPMHDLTQDIASINDEITSDPVKLIEYILSQK